jgi:CheY-like chemotaxis protein
MNTHQAQADKGDILIVDDTPDNLRLLSTMLQSQGYRVRKAINGQLALKGAQIAPPDLILLDINMPIMNGYEVCQQLKIRPETGKIPVIFISALDQVHDKIKAFQIGGVDYITKPFHVEEVLARVENQLKQLRLSKQLQEQNTRLIAEIIVRQRAEEKIFFLVSTTQAIAEASDFHAALSIILRSCCQTINWDFGEAWVPRSDGTSLERSQSWYASSPDLEEFRQHSLTISMIPWVGLAERVWSSKQPEWIEDVSVELEDIFPRSNLAEAVGLKASFGVPILLNNQVLAILVFLKKTVSPIQPHLVELVNAVATQLASLIQRKQTEEALRITQEKYHSIVENAVEGIFQTSPDGRFLSANLALAKI